MFVYNVDRKGKDGKDSFINSQSRLTLSQQSVALVSSKQLPSMLKLEIMKAHEAGEGFEEIAKCCQEAVSPLENVIKKWQ